MFKLSLISALASEVAAFTASSTFEANGNFVADGVIADANDASADHAGDKIIAITLDDDIDDTSLDWTESGDAKTFCGRGGCDGAGITLADGTTFTAEPNFKMAKDNVIRKGSDADGNDYDGSIVIKIEISADESWMTAQGFCADNSCPRSEITVDDSDGTPDSKASAEIQFTDSGSLVVDDGNRVNLLADDVNADYIDYAITVIIPSDESDPWTGAEAYCENNNDCAEATITYLDANDEDGAITVEVSSGGLLSDIFEISCDKLKMPNEPKVSITSIVFLNDANIAPWSTAEVYCETIIGSDSICAGGEITAKKAKGDKTASFVQAKIDRVGHELMLDFE